MKKVLYSLFTIMSISSGAQVFWTENFGTGCNPGNLASAYTGTNGAWTIMTVLSTGAGGNNFFVSATEAGMGANNCGDGCLSNSALTSRTLHVGSVANSYCGCIACPAGDCGAAYDDCNFDLCSGGIPNTDRRAESPVINCSSQSNIVISFVYMENGSGTSDDATLWYYDGVTWAQLDGLAKTPTTCAPQGRWTSFSVPLPASANGNANVKIGFRWVNNADGVGTDPSFAVDDITLTNTTGIDEFSFEGHPFTLSPNPLNQSTVIEFPAESSLDFIKGISLINLAGENIIPAYRISGNKIFLERGNLSAGMYLLTINGVDNKSVSARLVILD